MAQQKFNPAIELERELRSKIYSSLQGEIVEKVMRQAHIWYANTGIHEDVKGHTIKVRETLFPHLYELFEKVKSRLKFKEKVDFYLEGNPSINACAIPAIEKGDSHIVIINSALIDLMSEEELMFVVGHELGHIINRDTELMHLIRYVFPDEDEIPLALQHQIRLWRQFCELVADRYGYWAIGDLSVCVRNFYKMASGIDLGKTEVDIKVLLEENKKEYDYLCKHGYGNEEDHPVNPIRVQALYLYVNSPSEDVFNAEMMELLELLQRVGDGPYANALSEYLASAGFLAAKADGKICQEEIETIVEKLAATQMFARGYLMSMRNQEHEEMFRFTVNQLLRIRPDLQDMMFDYLIDIILADKKITTEEVDFLYNVGMNYFNYKKTTVADKLLKHIREDFEPITY